MHCSPANCTGSTPVRMPPMMEQPEQFNALLGTWLERTLGPPPPDMRTLRAEHLGSGRSAKHWPAPDRPEYAFIGRSNVGKSSLIDRPGGAAQTGRVSNTPAAPATWSTSGPPRPHRGSALAARRPAGIWLRERCRRANARPGGR